MPVNAANPANTAMPIFLTSCETEMRIWKYGMRGDRKFSVHFPSKGSFHLTIIVGKTKDTCYGLTISQTFFLPSPPALIGYGAVGGNMDRRPPLK